MNYFDHFVLAPYIIKATSLIGVSRKCGGNQFRHQFATLGILLDYKYYDDSVLLKSALLHDLVEDFGDGQLDEIRFLDDDGYSVVELVLEVTKAHEESKEEYLKRILEKGSVRAKILKCADRISNLTDMHLSTHTVDKIKKILDQTEQFVIPMAEQVNPDFVKELKDLIILRRKLYE